MATWSLLSGGFGRRIYDRFQSLLSQLEIHGAGVSTEDANQKFLRTKPGVDTLSFDDLYNNLRVFESDVKGSTASSSCTQNVAFVSSDSTNSTNEVSTAYGVSTSSDHNSQKEGSSSYTDDLMYSFFANQSSGSQLDHEDLKQVDEFDLEEIDLKWLMAMVFTKLKKFYKKTGRKLHFDAKEPVGFDKNKVERRDAGNTRYKARDNRRRHAKQDKHKATLTIDGEEVDWIGHAEDDTENYALMAFNSSNQAQTLSQMSAKDKSGLGYGNQIHEGALSYENEVLESVFDNRSTDVEDSPVNDRFAKVEGMHAVPPPMTGFYMPPKFDFGIDESKFTYDTLKSVPKLVESKPKAVSKPKVWPDPSIIEEYESDSDDEYMFKASVEQEKPSCAFINNVKHVKTPRKTVKDQDTCSQNHKDNPHQTLKGKGIGDSGCSRHMTGNKAYLVEYQEFNGGPVAFGGSKGQITGKDGRCTLKHVEARMGTHGRCTLRHVEARMGHGQPKIPNKYQFFV
uniref:Retrovirus-related Pol polyprotein from transposon TNT 1-94-like beta-barrel domain-containing protein n=1 Tax=Tanacetum cinerariifolium TaxID=118510 RepID=A0A6L2L6Y2_TANCI|nr:hypothetical protein [Tanacetum cinerariifolium]